MWKFSIVLSLLFLFGFFDGALAGVSLGVSPPFLEFRLASGVRRSATVEVANTGDTAVTVQYAVQDVFLSPQGDVLLLPGGSTAFSLVPFLTLKGERSFRLEPGKRIRVTFEVKMPPGAREGRYGALVFEAFPVHLEDVTVGIRTGTLLFLVPPLGDLSRVSVDLEEKEGELTLTLRNRGSIHVRLRGECVIRSEEGKILRRLVIPREGAFLLLPQGVREVPIPWDDLEPLPPGAYTAEVRVFSSQGRRTRPLATTTLPFSFPKQ